MQERHLWIGIVCTLLFGLCAPDLIATRHDPADGLDDADLSVSRPVVDPPDDGLTHLLAAVQVCTVGDDDRMLANAVWSGADVPLEDTRALLDANREALDRLRLALVAPHFRLPKLGAEEFDVVPEIPIETESLVALLRLESIYNARIADWDAAFESAIDILRFAQRIEGANYAALTTTMQSVGYRSVGLETLRKLAAMAPLENAQARRWVETLPSFRSDSAAWKRMWAVEYQQWKSLLGWITERAEHDFQHGEGAQTKPEYTLLDIAELRKETHRTLAAFADLTRTYQRASELDCSKLGSIVFPESEADHSASGFEQPETKASDAALEIATPDYREFFMKRCVEDTALAATQTLIALRGFHQENGQLPERLNDLIPTFLDAIPTDAFGGKPILYSRAEKLVYSLGAAGSASPGFGVADDDAMIELRYPIEF